MDSEVRRQAAVDAGHPEWAELPTTKAEAQALRASGWPDDMSPHFFTGKPCKYGHVSVRSRSDGNCVKCERAWDRTYEKNPARRARRNADVVYRQALKLKATPPWLTAVDHAALHALYEEAVRLTATTGIPHHVDHIVPLRATCRVTRKRIASGLHVPDNLQILKASDNQSKNCYFDGGW